MGYVFSFLFETAKIFCFLSKKGIQLGVPFFKFRHISLMIRYDKEEEKTIFKYEGTLLQ